MLTSNLTMRKDGLRRDTIRHIFILRAICALALCSCKGNINDKGFETMKVTTSDGVWYLFFSDPENGVGLADAQGDVIIEGQFDNIQQIMRGNEGDCLRVEWRYGLIDANGNEIFPKKYVDAEIKSDIIKCRISGTWKYDEISIEELASKYAVDKLYHAYCHI